MNAKRVFALARRVVRQIAHDRRTVALVVLAPMLMLTLGAILFRAEGSPIPIGLVNEDRGLNVPGAPAISLGQRIADELAAGGAFTVIPLEAGEIDDRLRDGSVQGAVVLAADLTQRFLTGSDHRAELEVRLEGSDPSRSRLVSARVAEAGVRALASLASSTLTGSMPALASGSGELPIAVKAIYLYPTESFDVLDYVAPVYIAFLTFFFVFLLTCVAFLRERSLGTMERLLATPATRVEIILGYLGGLGIFALIQVALIVSFTVWVLKIHYLGSLALLLLVVVLLALAGVGLGILASTFARTEFQVIQFIPIVIIPQGLLCGLIWPVEELPKYLQPLAYAMPLTYANRALRDIMLKGFGPADTGPNLAILAAFVLGFVALAALTVRREVA